MQPDTRRPALAEQNTSSGVPDGSAMSIVRQVGGNKDDAESIREAYIGGKSGRVAAIPALARRE